LIWKTGKVNTTSLVKNLIRKHFLSNTVIGSTFASENLLHNDKKLSEQDRIKLIQATWQSNREETRKQMLGLLISAVLVGVVVITFIGWWTQRYG